MPTDRYLCSSRMAMPLRMRQRSPRSISLGWSCRGSRHGAGRSGWWRRSWCWASSCPWRRCCCRPSEVSLAAAPAVLRPSILWEVGPLSGPHAGFGTDCKTCHETPFVPVRSTACLACHAGTGQHADPHRVPGLDLAETRCETCHHEHKGAVQAIREDQGFCVSCHGDIKRQLPGSALKDVTDFGRDHPDFAPSIVTDAAAGTVSADPARHTRAMARSLQSALHPRPSSDPAGIKGPDGGRACCNAPIATSLMPAGRRCSPCAWSAIASPATRCNSSRAIPIGICRMASRRRWRAGCWASTAVPYWPARASGRAGSALRQAGRCTGRGRAAPGGSTRRRRGGTGLVGRARDLRRMP